MTVMEREIEMFICIIVARQGHKKKFEYSYLTQSVILLNSCK